MKGTSARPISGAEPPAPMATAARPTRKAPMVTAMSRLAAAATDPEARRRS